MDGMDMTHPRSTANITKANTPIIQQMNSKYKLDLYKFRICFGVLYVPSHLWFSFCCIIQCTVSDKIHTAKICLRESCLHIHDIYIRSHTRCKGDL